MVGPCAGPRWIGLVGVVASCAGSILESRDPSTRRSSAHSTRPLPTHPTPDVLQSILLFCGSFADLGKLVVGGACGLGIAVSGEPHTRRRTAVDEPSWSALPRIRSSDGAILPNTSTKKNSPLPPNDLPNHRATRLSQSPLEASITTLPDTCWLVKELMIHRTTPSVIPLHTRTQPFFL